MTDMFEQDVRRMLNQSVDARLGRRRPAPPFTPDADAARDDRGVRPWLMPLLAAACVVAMAVAAVTGAHALTGRHATPARPPAPSPAPTPTGPSHLVTLGTARLSLPAGWIARGYQLYTPSIEPLVASPSWCLTPESLPVSTAPGGCPISFGPIPQPHTSHVDANVAGGLWGNPLYCIPRGGGGGGLESEAAGDLPFGGRSADFRDWRFRCNDGSSWWIQQYLVVSDPGFIMFSEGVTPEIAAVMKSIAAHSTLPARTSALRYFDEGTVLTATAVAGGVRIRLQRRFVSPTNHIVHQLVPSELDYVIPLALFKEHQNFFRPKAEVMLYTDGTTVTWAVGG